MQSALNPLEEQIVTLERRSRANVNILEQGGSPWRSFSENPKVLRADVVHLIERAFDCGGFIAGGCARWLRSSGQISALQRGTYVHEGGDIDIFFHTLDGWRGFVKPLVEIGQDWPKVVLSRGRLAANINLQGGKTKSAFSDPPTIQAICCITGSPDEILRSFDFHNSMVAFDRDKVWIVDDWEENEHKKELKVAWWGSRSIPFRVLKYMNKYGYRRIVNASDAMFDQLVAATDSMTNKQKDTSYNCWKSILETNVCDLEMKLTILASTARGIETNDLFSMSKNSVERVFIGTYEQAINGLLLRQERAKNTPESRRDSYSDPRDFDAEEYCWAV